VLIIMDVKLPMVLWSMPGDILTDKTPAFFGGLGRS